MLHPHLPTGWRHQVQDCVQECYRDNTGDPMWSCIWDQVWSCGGDCLWESMQDDHWQGIVWSQPLLKIKLFCF